MPRKVVRILLTHNLAANCGSGHSSGPCRNPLGHERFNNKGSSTGSPLVPRWLSTASFATIAGRGPAAGLLTRPRVRSHSLQGPKQEQVAEAVRRPRAGRDGVIQFVGQRYLGCTWRPAGSTRSPAGRGWRAATRQAIRGTNELQSAWAMRAENSTTFRSRRLATRAESSACRNGLARRGRSHLVLWAILA